MKKKHLITCLGLSFLSVGMIGGVWTGVNAMPSLINKYQSESNEFNSKEIIFDEKIDISKLNINLDMSNITFKKSESNNILIERVGNKELTKLYCEKENGSLSLIEKYSEKKVKEIKSIDDIVESALDEMFQNDSSEVIVYIPNEINLDIETSTGSLRIDDDVISESVFYRTQNGSIYLNEEIKFNNLNIESLNEISLSTSELFDIENVYLRGGGISIHFENEEMFVDDIFEKIPSNLVIESNEPPDYTNIVIKSTIPVSKNIDIKATSGVRFRIPLLKDKFNFDIVTTEGIDFRELEYSEKYQGTALEKFFEANRENNINDLEYYDKHMENYNEYVENYNEPEFMKSYKGIMNEDLKENDKEYNINIISSRVEFE